MNDLVDFFDNPGKYKGELVSEIYLFCQSWNFLLFIFGASIFIYCPAVNHLLRFDYYKKTFDGSLPRLWR